jgi:hypothetical protein
MAMIVSMFVYLGVLYVLVDPTEAGEVDDILLMALSVVALGSLAAIPIMRKIMMGGLGLSSGGAPFRPVDPAPLEQAEAAYAEALAKYHKATITGLALAESIALYGFVAAFLSHDPKLSLPFMLLGVAVAALQFPREDGVRSLLTPAERAALTPRGVF